MSGDGRSPHVGVAPAGARLLIAGAGSVGQWLGARLAAAGHDVTLLLRDRFADAIEADGLRVSGHTDWHGHVATTREPAGGPFDGILLTCKAYDTAPLAEAVAPFLAGDGVLASMQNGLGNAQKLAAVAGERAAVALTSHGMMIGSPGHVVHAGTGTTTVGPADASHAPDAARRLHAWLADAGLDPTWQDDMRPAIWMKAIVNAAINPVAAIFDVPNGGIRGDPELLALSRALTREAAALAARARVELPADPWQTVQTVLDGTAANRCSMLQDMDARRATEIEQITGRMVRLGELLLVSMPRNESVYGRVKDRERELIGAERSERLAWDELQSAALPI